GGDGFAVSRCSTILWMVAGEVRSPRPTPRAAPPRKPAGMAYHGPPLTAQRRPATVVARGQLQGTAPRQNSLSSRSPLMAFSLPLAHFTPRDWERQSRRPQAEPAAAGGTGHRGASPLAMPALGPYDVPRPDDQRSP